MRQQRKSDFWFDKDAADKVVEFFAEYIHHTKGEWAGQPFVLQKWQAKHIRELFGWKRKDGTRKYRTTYWEIPRKNGKSFLASAIGLYLLFADGEPGAEIYSAAADRDQAAIVFDMAREIVAASPALAARAEIYRRSIVVPSSGSSYKVISADANTKFGYSVHGLLFDELMTQTSRALWDALTTASGARRQPLIFAISTAGFDKHSICWEIHEYAQKVLDGTVNDPSFYPVLYGADDDDDWTSVKVWRNANPGYGVTVKADYIKQECERAKSTPTYENTFRRLLLDQWTEQETRWLQMTEWDACNLAPIVPEQLKGRVCFAGLDLASTTDIAALVLVFPPPNSSLPDDRLEITDPRIPKGVLSDVEQRAIRYVENAGGNATLAQFIDDYEPIGRRLWDDIAATGWVKLQNGKLLMVASQVKPVQRVPLPVNPAEKFIVLPFFWIPEDGLHDRVRKDGVPYDVWANQGLIEPTEGNLIDYRYIMLRLGQCRLEYNLKMLAFDRWGSQKITTDLCDEYGFTTDEKAAKLEQRPLLVQFGQGFASMSAPTKELLNLILARKLNHGGNAVLRWMAQNVVVKQDPAGNLKPDKGKSKEKIDGVIALIMGLDIAIRNANQGQGSKYEREDLMFL